MKLVIALACLFSAPVFANNNGPIIEMQPPYYDSVNRLQTVLESDKIDLGGAITNVAFVDALTVEITDSNDCLVTVKLKVDPTLVIGASHYSVKSASHPKCN